MKTNPAYDVINDSHVDFRDSNSSTRYKSWKKIRWTPIRLRYVQDRSGCKKYDFITSWQKIQPCCRPVMRSHQCFNEGTKIWRRRRKRWIKGGEHNEEEEQKVCCSKTYMETVVTQYTVISHMAWYLRDNIKLNLLMRSSTGVVKPSSRL